MGNNLDTQKISSLILELSESSDLNAKFLINNFNNLIELTGGQHQPYQQIKDLFFELIKSNPENFSYNHLVNFGNNVLQYITLEQKENYLTIIKPCIILLYIIVESLYEIFKDNLNINFIQSIQNISWDVLKTIFPFNLILFCIDTILNEEKLILNDRELYFSILFISFSILYHLIILSNNKNNENLKIENIDFYKFIFSSNSFLEREKFEKFIQIIYSSFFKNFINIIKHNVEINLLISQRYLNILISFMIYFLEDINHLIFNDIKSDEQNLSFYFKNQNNEIYFQFLSKLDQNLQKIPILMIEMINYYNKYFNEITIKSIMLNNRLINEFIILFYHNYDLLNDIFKDKVHYLFIKLFNIIPNLLEISSVKEFIPNLLKKLMSKENKNLNDYILFNDIITSDNYKKLSIDYENDKLTQEDFGKIINHFLNSIENLQKNNNNEYKSGMIVYSLIILYNITLFLHQYNSHSNLNKLFHILEIEVEKEDKDIISKFVIFYFCILIIINLSNNLEEHSQFHMLLLKNNKIIENLNNKLSILCNSSNSKKLFQKIKEKKNIIDELINRIIKKFNDEKTDWRFNQDVEIIRIINKVIFLPINIKKEFIKVNNFNQLNIEKGIITSNIKNNIYDISTLNDVYK